MDGADAQGGAALLDAPVTTGTMRAAVVERTGAPDALVTGRVPVPVPVGAEFLVKVVAAGVDRVDSAARAGLVDGISTAAGPIVLGHDFSGIVVTSPYEAHPLKAGDEVYGMVAIPRNGGAYAEYVTVPSLGLNRKPSTLSHVEAAGVPLAALTAWGMVVDLGHVHEGQRVLVHGAAGGVGHFAVQLAAYFGAHVIATAPASAAGWLSELGAHDVLDPSAAAGDAGHDVDVILDVAGDGDPALLDALRPGGLIVGLPSPHWPELARAASRAGVRSTAFAVAADGATLAVLSRLLESGDVRVYVDQIFELRDAADAHRAVDNQHTRGTIVLTVCDG